MKSLLLAALVVLMLPGTIQAAPPWWESITEGSSGYEPARRMKTLHNFATIRKYQGNFSVLVVPVEYTDELLTAGGTDGVGDSSTPAYWQDLFFGNDTTGQGPYPYPSMAQYLSTQSGTAFRLIGTVHDPVQLKFDAAWYAKLVSSSAGQSASGCFGLGRFFVNRIDDPAEGGATVIQQEVLEVLLNEGVDLTKYMNNTDDMLDGIIIIHAGAGAEQSSASSNCDNNNDIWSHVLDRTVSTSAGSYRTRILLAAERFWHPRERISYPSGIGVIVHEFGHVLGFPDLYDTSGNGYGVGIYSLMSLGLYDRTADHDDRFGPDIRPKNLDPWLRLKAGWLNEEDITNNRAFVPLYATTETDVIYRFGRKDTPNEYFLTEYRPATGWDADLPSSGLMLWHIDENIPKQNSVCIPGPITSCDSTHYKVSVVQADGRWDLELGASQGGNPGDPDDSYKPGAVIDDSSSPALRNWGETDVGARINVLRYEDKHLLTHLIGDRSSLPEAPRIGGLPPIKILVGQEYIFQPEGLDNTNRVFRLFQAPAAMKLNEKTGEVRWKPTSTGSYTVKLNVENIAGNDTRTWSILVVDGNAPVPGCSCQVGTGAQWASLPAFLLMWMLVTGYLALARIKNRRSS